METLVRKWNLVTTDAVALFLVFLIPTLSHFAPFPLYLTDPMRIVLFGTLLATRNWKNTLIMALTIPLFSFIVSLHPAFPQCFLISGELTINILLFAWMSLDLKKHVGISAFVSILISKVLYYVIKNLIIVGGISFTGIISIEFGIQILSALFLSLLFVFTFKGCR